MALLENRCASLEQEVETLREKNAKHKAKIKVLKQATATSNKGAHAAENGEPLFEGFTFCFDFAPGVPLKDRQHLTSRITDNGGSISYTVSSQVRFICQRIPKESLILLSYQQKPKTSVLVMHGNNELLGASSSSSKARTARQHHIPIVSSTYITRCLEECHILPPASFIQGNLRPLFVSISKMCIVSQVQWGKISLRP